MRFSLHGWRTRLEAWLASQAQSINQRGIIKDVHSGLEVTPGYLFILAVANLIALCGLLLNSAPVIIGAMLISPLMGPFLNIGFAFVTGDNLIWKKSVRKIVLSVTMTLVVAALATYLSPLKELTSEIASRTKPNLYDLVIAFLAGLAGASALCSKKDYLTVVPGVAIATAVIPPLSVAGYGVGTWNLKVFFGGFFLFFTNLVAIIIATCAVFFFYGFRRSMSVEVDLSQVKQRLAYLLAVLVLLSIPLAYTLFESVGEVRLRSAIRQSLRDGLEKRGKSHLTTFSYTVAEDGVLHVRALANVVHYLDEKEALRLQGAVGAAVGRKTLLSLEQVKVLVGGLREVPVAPSVAPALQKVEPVQTPGSAPGLSTAIMREKERIARIVAPAKIEKISLAMGGYSSSRLDVHMKLRRDAPLGAEERALLARMITVDLGHPVALQVETVPLIPLLVFSAGSTVLSEEMKRDLLVARSIGGTGQGGTVLLEAYPDRSDGRGSRLSMLRLEAVAGFLVDVCQVPRSRIETRIGPRRGPGAAVRVTLPSGAMPTPGYLPD